MMVNSNADLSSRPFAFPSSPSRSYYRFARTLPRSSRRSRSGTRFVLPADRHRRSLADLDSVASRDTCVTVPLARGTRFQHSFSKMQFCCLLPPRPSLLRLPLIDSRSARKEGAFSVNVNENLPNESVPVAFASECAGDFRARFRLCSHRKLHNPSQCRVSVGVSVCKCVGVEKKKRISRSVVRPREQRTLARPTRPR